MNLTRFTAWVTPPGMENGPETKNMKNPGKIHFREFTFARAAQSIDLQRYGDPLLKLINLTPADSADIYVKFEAANPTGSMKYRMALSMIEGAEKRSQLKPGGTAVEYTGGSTGSSLARVCAMKGYKAHFVCSDAFAAEKLQTMRAFGAQLDIIPSGDGKSINEERTHEQTKHATDARPGTIARIRQPESVIDRDPSGPYQQFTQVTFDFLAGPSRKMREVPVPGKAHPESTDLVV